MKDRDIGPSRNDEGIGLAIDILKQRFGARLQTGAAIREQHGHTTTWLENQPPDAVVFAQSTEDVAEVVKVCATHNAPIIPFGSGTSLEGHVNAPRGGISLDLMQMNRVLEVHAGDLTCTVEPGVTRDGINTHLRDMGLFFPIDPGANASLGGMTATSASGTNAVRYGTMRDNVLSLEAVLADGRIVKTAQRAKKTSAGYDLTRLLVGSEGTLGIVTKITLRLHGIPEAIRAARCVFPSVSAATEAVMATIQYGLPIARIELLDAQSVEAANRYSGLGLPEGKPMLLLEFHGSEAGVDEQVAAFQDISAEFGAEEFAAATTLEARNALWKARHDMYWAQKSLRPGALAVASDVCVPISRLADAVGAAQDKAAEMGLMAPIVGHVGDGNFHALILVDKDDAAGIDQGNRYLSWLSEMAISMEGTCTGEHGIGQGKMAYLDKELGETATDMMRAIKAALDPQNILNPGKIV